MRLLPSLIGALFLAAPAAAQEQPNILLIIGDDMGLDTSLCYDVGDQQAPMPTLEGLCSQGLVYDNVYSAPVCTPTRATIMSGRYGFRTGVGTAIPEDGQGVGLSEDETSLFDLLNTTDYSSAVIGKWHISSSYDDLDQPAALGVNEYFGIFAGEVDDYFEWDAVENGSELTISGYATTVLTDRAIDWIGEQESPWFLWLAYNAPHTPFHLPPTDLHSFDDLPDDEAAIAEDPLPYYQAALEALDSEMGRLLDSLPEDVRDETIVMFLGDNGSPNQTADEVYDERGAKGGIFEGGTHVPFIVQGPGVVAGGRSDALVNTTDLHATIAALAGVEAPDAVDSYDISATFSAEDQAGPRTYAYVEHFYTESAGEIAIPVATYGSAIRDSRYKLVAVDDEPQMLFDLEEDPFETTDLLEDGGTADAQAKADELAGILDDLWESELSLSSTR